MKIIGICGSSGSGKSTVCTFFAERGIPVLDCDRIYHNLVEAPSDCLEELGETFGRDLIAGGKLDRKKLGAIVFSDPEKLSLLNEISHRYVVIELEKEILRFQKENKVACVIDAPMLFEARLDEKCDAVIAVIADKKIQLERISLRDGIEPELAMKRISNQTPPEVLAEKADFVIENNGTLQELYVRFEKVLNLIITNKGE